METKAEWLAQLEETHDSWNWCRHELIHEPTLNLEREKNSTRHRRGKQSINQSVNYRHEPTAVSIVQRRHAFNETFMIREKCHLVVSLGTFCYFLLSAFSMPPLEHSVVDLVKLNLLRAVCFNYSTQLYSTNLLERYNSNIYKQKFNEFTMRFS